MLNDNDSMFSVWANHFETLAKSRREDVLFTAEEVEKEIRRLKRRKLQVLMVYGRAYTGGWK